MGACFCEGDLLAAYGLLRPASPEPAPAFIMAGLSHERPCVIAGRLIDLGGYPGLVSGPGRVACDLMRVASPAAGRQLDAFEDYCPDAPAGSRYLRIMTPLLGESVSVWAYWWNGARSDGTTIASGDWLAR